MPLPPDIPPSLACRVPDAILDLPETSWPSRVTFGDDSCQLDARRYFLRGNITLPIVDTGATFVWTVWAELDKRHFKHALARWTRPDRIKEPPYPALLANYLPLYPSTQGLPCHLHTRLVGQRFHLALDPGDHPLVAEQRDGIALPRLREILRLMDASRPS